MKSRSPGRVVRAGLSVAMMFLFATLPAMPGAAASCVDAGDSIPGAFPSAAVSQIEPTGRAAAAAPLRPEHARWLEDAAPIITRVERDVFAALGTDRERETFIGFFWRQRDPLPDTPQNEFQAEYAERVRFADENFHIGSSKRGSQTDRGYYYCLLGKPLERHFYTTQSQIWPLELWFYQGETGFGLPPYFYLIFYQAQGLGEYKLYYPGAEGPEKLVIPQMLGRTLNRAAAQDVLKQLGVELSQAAISYIPGEQPFGMEAFASDNLIASIRRFPEKKVADGYARNYLAFKDRVETEHFDSFIGSAWTAKVLATGGQPFLHWAVEPDRMSFGRDGGAYYAAFELDLRLEDAAGRPVFERSEQIPLRLTEAQYKTYAARRFAFQDLLPVVPGDYRLLVLLKNRTGRDFTSFETRLSVPETAAASPGAIFLYHRRDPVPEARANGLKAFAFGGHDHLVGARNEFPPGTELGIYVQPGRPVPEGAVWLVEVASVDTAAKAASFRTPALPAEAGADGASLGPVSLASVAPGYYRAEATLLSRAGEGLWRRTENFILLAQAAPVAPWVYAKTHGPFPGPEHLKVLAAQSLLAGRYEDARAAASRALEMRDEPGIRLLLGKSLYALSDHRASLDVLAPLEAAADTETAKVIALNQAALKNWEAALVHLERLLSEASEIGVLNLAAECHLNLGRPDRALALARKSLGLLPDQPVMTALEARAVRLLEAQKKSS